MPPGTGQEESEQKDQKVSLRDLPKVEVPPHAMATPSGIYERAKDGHTIYGMADPKWGERISV